jgi:hypothetical protein
MLLDRHGAPAHAPADDALWLVPASGGRPVEIEDPLLPSNWLEGYTHQYSGQVAWGQQFSWFSGPGS